eukprot:263170_1
MSNILRSACSIIIVVILITCRGMDDTHSASNSDDDDWLPPLLLNETVSDSDDELIAPNHSFTINDTFPTRNPTGHPTSKPTRKPTKSPTHKPSKPPKPSRSPTSKPTKRPTSKPTDLPTSKPTAQWSNSPQKGASPKLNKQRKHASNSSPSDDQLLESYKMAMQQTKPSNNNSATVIKLYVMDHNGSEYDELVTKFQTHLITHHRNDLIIIDTFEHISLTLRPSLYYFCGTANARVEPIQHFNSVLSSKLHVFSDIMKDVRVNDTYDGIDINTLSKLTSWFQTIITEFKKGDGRYELDHVLQQMKAESCLNPKMLREIQKVWTGDVVSFDLKHLMDRMTVRSLLSFYTFAATAAWKDFYGDVVSSLKQNEWIPTHVYVEMMSTIHGMYSEALCNITEAMCNVKETLSCDVVWRRVHTALNAYIIGDYIYHLPRCIPHNAHVVFHPRDVNVHALQIFLNDMKATSRLRYESNITFDYTIEKYVVNLKPTKRSKQVDFEVRKVHIEDVVLTMSTPKKRKKKKKDHVINIKVHYISSEEMGVTSPVDVRAKSKALLLTPHATRDPYVDPMKTNFTDETVISYVAKYELLHAGAIAFLQKSFSVGTDEELVMLMKYVLLGHPLLVVKDDVWTRNITERVMDELPHGSKLRIFVDRVVYKNQSVNFADLEDSIFLTHDAIELFITLMERAATLAYKMSWRHITEITGVVDWNRDTYQDVMRYTKTLLREIEHILITKKYDQLLSQNIQQRYAELEDAHYALCELRHGLIVLNHVSNWIEDPGHVGKDINILWIGHHDAAGFLWSGLEQMKEDVLPKRVLLDKYCKYQRQQRDRFRSDI